MSTLGLTETILGFVGIVAVGWLLRRTGILRRSDAHPINQVIIYVGLPAMIFRAVHGAVLGPDLAIVAAISWGVFAVTALVAWALSRALALPRPIAGGFILAAALGNTGYIGYPITEALLGESGLVRAIFYDVFGTVGCVLIVGLVIAERFGEAEGNRLHPLLEALTFPAVIALAVGLLLRPVAIPEMVSVGIDTLANLVVPLIMIVVGVSLRPGAIREQAVPLAFLSGIRLVLAPLVALAIGTLALSDPAAVRLVVLEAGMPSMMLTLVVGERFGLDTDFIAAAILVTTVACVVTIPLMQVIAG